MVSFVLFWPRSEAQGQSHGSWKANLSKYGSGKKNGRQETDGNIAAYTTQISSWMIEPFDGMTIDGAIAITRRILVPGAGIEPARSFEQGILSP